jgi:hypothetical protein
MVVPGSVPIMPLCLRFAGLDSDLVVLYCELISHRGSWVINKSGCRALADCTARAATVLLSRHSGSAAQR